MRQAKQLIFHNSVEFASHYKDTMAGQVFKIHLPQEIRWDAVIPEEWSMWSYKHPDKSSFLSW